MSKLQTIKNKINSVKRLHGIVCAVEMISMYRARKYLNILTAVSYYFNLLKHVEKKHNFTDVVRTHCNSDSKDSSIVLLCFGTHKGLVSGLKQSIYKEIQRKLVSYSVSEVWLCGLGSYIAINKLCKTANIPLYMLSEAFCEKELYATATKIIFRQAYTISNSRSQLFVFLYPHLLNTHNYEIRKISIQFNFNLYQSWSDKSRDFAVNTHKFITMYFMSLLSFAFYNAISVENISRNLAMHGASEAAKNNIDELTVHFNKTRQEIITNELNELTVGSKAVKS